jgi:hypothetical protein
VCTIFVDLVPLLLVANPVANRQSFTPPRFQQEIDMIWWRDRPWLRYLSYFFLLLIMFQVLVFIAAQGNDALNLLSLPHAGDAFGTSEFSIVEMLQTLILAATVLALALRSRTGDPTRALSDFLALVFAVLLIREQDYHLDRWLHAGAWIWPALIACACAAWMLYRRSTEIGAQVRAFSDTAGFGLILAGLAIALGFSRIFGQKALWIGLLDEESYRIGKLAAEEMTELLGYSLILAGCLEFRLPDFLQAFREKSTGSGSAA